MGEGNRWEEFNFIIDTLDLDIKEKGLLLIIFRYINHKTGYANPSRALLKKLTRITDNRTLDNMINSLIKKGFLYRESGKGIRSKYFIKVGVEITPSVIIEPSVKITPLVGVKITPPVGVEITPQKEKEKKIKENKKESSLDSIINTYTTNLELINTLKEFLKMRKSIKKPMTDKAMKLLIIKLDKLGSNDNEKIEILNQSIFNSWQGIFPLKNKLIEGGEENYTQSVSLDELLGERV